MSVIDDAVSGLSVASDSVPNSIETQTDSAPSFADFAPDEYKSKDWVQNVKDVPTFFKMFDDQKTALSKRPAGIPQDNATDEEWSAFNKSLGVPEKEDEYDFSIEGKEFTEEDKAFHDALRPLLKEAGITKRQLARLAPAFDKMIGDLSGQGQAKSQEQDADFDKRTSEVFGPDRDKVIAETKKFIADNTNKSLPFDWDGMSNSNLVALMGMAKEFQGKFVSEDQLPAGGAAAAPATEADLRAKARNLMASEAYVNEFDINHARVLEEVNSIYGSLKSS